MAIEDQPEVLVQDSKGRQGSGGRSSKNPQKVLNDTIDAKTRGKFTQLVGLGGALEDAFGRMRVSNPETLFDSKQIFDNLPFFWDDQEVTGSGTSSTYSKPHARSRLAVSASTAGKRVRQTFMRFNYQPGKSQLINMTGILGVGEAGITTEIGIIDDDNGLAFKSKDGIAYVTRRSSVTGSAVDEDVAQSSWNLDVMDGSGDSGITLDFDKTLIFMIDFEWLAVGRVRIGVIIGGEVYYVHEFKHSNILDVIYMSTPNLPLRYSIENDGTGGASSMDHICSTVISEGGAQNIGLLRHSDSGAVTGLSAGTEYAALGIRLKSTHIAAGIILETLSVIATTTNDQLHWELVLNPTVAGTFTYADEPNSAVQIAQGSSANTITGGTPIDGGYFATASPVASVIKNALRLGAAINGTVDEIILMVRPITNNIAIQASLTRREIS